MLSPVTILSLDQGKIYRPEPVPAEPDAAPATAKTAEPPETPVAEPGIAGLAARLVQVISGRQRRGPAGFARGQASTVGR